MDASKTYEELLTERQGKGFSEIKLTKVLREVLLELGALHASHRAHGQISPDALVFNVETNKSGLKPPSVTYFSDDASIRKDLYDLGISIVLLLSGQALNTLQDSDGHLRWQVDRLISDNFRMVIEKAIASNPSSRYMSALEMLQDLDEQGKKNSFHTINQNSTHVAQDYVHSSADAMRTEDSFLSELNAPSGSHPTPTILQLQESEWKPGQLFQIIGAALLGGVLVALTGFFYQRFNNQAHPAVSGSIINQDINLQSAHDLLQSPVDDAKNSAQVTFSGINLPITNRLCTNRGNFCIYNLADLVNKGSGKATYSFSETQGGEIVNINGTISITNLQMEAGRRIITFAFRDDQSKTSPGWAAAGSFKLDQDKSRPGILTRFRTLESFGPKTPVGLENTSYVFPR